MGPRRSNVQAIPTRDQRSHELSIILLIRAELRCRRFDRTLLRHRRSVIEWMSKRSGRLDPFQTSLREWKRAKKRRTGGEWVYRGANIVNKARQGQLRRARASTDGFLSFIDDYGFAVLSHRNRGCKTVRSGADYHRVIYVRLGHLNSTTTTAHCIFSRR